MAYSENWLDVFSQLAAAFDIEQNNRVSTIEIDISRRVLTMKIQGEGDLLLEKWAVQQRRKLFEQVYGVQLRID